MNRGEREGKMRETKRSGRKNWVATGNGKRRRSKARKERREEERGGGGGAAFFPIL